MKICLIVDDSSIVRMGAKKILTELKFEIGEADDGLAAVEACRKRMPMWCC